MSGEKGKDANYINNVLTSLRRSLFLALLAQKFGAFEGLFDSDRFGSIRIHDDSDPFENFFEKNFECSRRLLLQILEREHLDKL